MSENKGVLIDGVLTKATRLKDGGMSLNFHTSEVNPQQLVDWSFKSLNQFGYIYFSPNEIEKELLDEIDAVEADITDGTKTPSQRLRNTLYVWWQQDNQGYQEFKGFYANKMERLIEHIKNKLD